MKIEIEIDQYQLWRDVFGSSPFSFGTWWTDAEYLDGSDWENPGRISLTCTDEVTGEETTKIISAEDLARALPTANDLVSIDLWDFDNYDSIASDAILQVAVLGEVIYG